MTKAIIIHGIGGSSRDNWLPWLSSELEKIGVEAIVPNFPRTNTPALKEWLSELSACEIDEGTIMVGHSLGTPLILAYLETAKKKIKAAFFVAGFAEPTADKTINSLIRSFVGRQ